MKKTNKLFAAFLLLGLTISGCSLMPTATSRRSKSSSQVQEVNEFDAKTHEIYELYLANGGTLTYEEWLESIKGAKGDKGDKGDTGATGATGAQGPKGDKGDQGDPGQDGKDGVDGQDGKDGVDGQNGVDGTTPHIGNNGNWWIGEQDTGVCAGGQNGEPGVGISSIAFNGEGELIVTFDNGNVVNLGTIGSSVHQHEYEAETLDATCTIDGYYKFTCKTCGHIETVINKAQGHLFEAYREKVPATCTTEGVKSRKCTVCGYEETEVIPAHDHNFSENCVYDANKHWHYCTTCGVVSDEADHSFVNHTCSVCSYTESTNVSSDGLLYALNEDGASYALISIGTCTDTVIDIPSSYNGYPVTSIGYGAFQGSNITSVTMPNSIVQIGSNAFKNCSNLASVCLSASLTSTPDYGFYGCSSLTSVVVPEGVRSVGSNCFENCTSLRAVTLPSTLTNLYYACFRYCGSLTSVVIPASVRTISGNAFYGCYNLANVVFNEGLKTIGYDSFRYCSKLTTITIPSTVNYIEYRAFCECSGITSIIFKQIEGWQRGQDGDPIYKELIETPEMAAQLLVGSDYNWYCKYVASGIGYDYRCIALQVGESISNSVRLSPNTATSAITYESSNEEIATVDESGLITGVSNGAVIVTVKSSGLTVRFEVRVGDPEIDGNFAFYKLSDDEYAIKTNPNNTPTGDLVIPSTYNGKAVTKILSNGFDNNYDITSVYIPSSIEEIGYYAFGYCLNCKLIKFESAVAPIIGDNVFGTTWDYSDFHILVPYSGLNTYLSINADYWQEYAVDNLVGYNPNDD